MDLSSGVSKVDQILVAFSELDGGQRVVQKVVTCQYRRLSTIVRGHVLA